jgi:hypothetical protein
MKLAIGPAPMTKARGADAADCLGVIPPSDVDLSIGYSG